MNIWRKKRQGMDLTISDIANYLEIPYDKYALIDRGIIKMPKKYIEKFNELMNKTKGENKVRQLSREETVDLWWSKMCDKNEDGKFYIYDKLEEFNIETLGELDELLGYKSRGASSNYLNRGEDVGYDLKNKYYSFFENELNIQKPKKTDERKRKEISYRNSDEYKELIAWYNTINIKEWASSYGMSRKEFKQKTNFSQGTVHSMFTKLYKTPCLRTLQALKSFIDDYDEKHSDEKIAVVSESSTEKQESINVGANDFKNKLLIKYHDIINNINIDIETMREKIDNLEKEKEFYERVLQDINED